MIKRILIGVGALTIGVGGYFAWKLRPQVEEIPEELEEIAEEVDPLAVTFRAQGPEPELTLRDLKGQTSFFVIQGKESMQAGEGVQLTRALNRWELPEDVKGYWVGDAEGAGLFAKKIEDAFVKHMRVESQWPIYLDFDGAMVASFNLPKGHTGLVVLGPEGEILMRNSGDPDEQKLEEIRELLGGKEPPPPRDSPEFTLGEVDKAACKEDGCLFVFLGGPVARTDIPRIEGGFESEDDDAPWEQTRKPDIRNVSQTLFLWDLKETKVKTFIIGELSGLDEDAEHVDVVATAPELREAFELGETDSAMVIVKDDKLSFLEKDTIRFWKFGLAGDVLGVEASGPDDEEDEDEE